MLHDATARYDPSIFSVDTLAQAKRIILTPEIGRSTDERWARETPHICDLITNQMVINGDSIIVDYGCGVGRIARELIRRHKCHVIGVDISASMRALAASYVNSERFMACSPAMLPAIGARADVVIAIWVLQHVALPRTDLAMIEGIMKPGAWLFVVNEQNYRCVPSNQGWINDGIDIRGILEKAFIPVADGKMSKDVVGMQCERTFWAAYSNGKREWLV